MMQWLLRDWLLKVITFFLAVGLWNYAVGEERIEVTRTVPLHIEVKNPQMSVFRVSTDNVQVTMNAPRALLSDITSGKIQVVHEIDSDVKTAGDYSFRLEPREIRLPTPQIRVTKIEPEVIHIKLDELIVKKLIVKPNFVGEPAIGYKLNQDEIQLDPNALLIEGPKGQLEKLDGINTEKIDLVGRIRSFRRTVSLDLPPNVKPLSEVLIDVFVPIKEEAEEKNFENIGVKVLQNSGEIKAEVKPSSVSFQLKGAHRQIQRLAPENILAFVDVTGLRSGEHEIPLKIILPEDVSLVKDPPIVKVVVKK